MFKIKTIESDEILYTKTQFPAGETNITIDKDSFRRIIFDENMIIIDWNYENDNELFELLLICRALRQLHSNILVELFVPYFPHSRMDRVMNKNNAFSLKSMVDIIKLSGISCVTTVDCHSNIVETLFTDSGIIFKDIPQHRTFLNSELIDYDKEFILLSPDAGALKKIYNITKELDFDKEIEVINASKVRDNSGMIVSTKIDMPIYVDLDAMIWVVDDICDGGRTFIEIAKVLREKCKNKLCLYTTHGIYSKGIEALEQYYDEVHCYNDMRRK